MLRIHRGIFLRERIGGRNGVDEAQVFSGDMYCGGSRATSRGPRLVCRKLAGSV